MLQRLNNWGRKSLIACVLLAITAVSLIGSPEVPGKVMALAGFDVPSMEGWVYERVPCDVYTPERGPRYDIMGDRCLQ